MMEVSVQVQEKINSQLKDGQYALLCLFLLFRSLINQIVPPILGRVICFTQFTNANADLIQKHFHRHTQR